MAEKKSELGDEGEGNINSKFITYILNKYKPIFRNATEFHLNGNMPQVAINAIDEMIKEINYHLSNNPTMRKEERAAFLDSLAKNLNHVLDYQISTSGLFTKAILAAEAMHQNPKEYIDRPYLGMTMLANLVENYNKKQPHDAKDLSAITEQLKSKKNENDESEEKKLKRCDPKDILTVIDNEFNLKPIDIKKPMKLPNLEHAQAEIIPAKRKRDVVFGIFKKREQGDGSAKTDEEHLKIINHKIASYVKENQIDAYKGIIKAAKQERHDDKETRQQFKELSQWSPLQEKSYIEKTKQLDEKITTNYNKIVEAVSNPSYTDLLNEKINLQMKLTADETHMPKAGL